MYIKLALSATDTTSHLILTMTLYNRYHYCHSCFKDKES